MEPIVTKRLHISGLTPSISQQDLSQRLSTFGNVKSLDGLGALDAVGQPKKFAYATLEATPAKLSKCLNTLSGSTWKGTKLRIGEAKPDFRERLQAENEKHAALEPPRKRARWKYAPYRAKHAQDMSPITLEKAKLKGGWVVTALGRIHRPLRMRPLRPLLPAAPAGSSHLRKDLRGKEKGPVKMRKRIKKQDVRARIRKIDMVKYGSEYLKGRFLEVDVPFNLGSSAAMQPSPVEPVDEIYEEDSDEEMSGDLLGEDGEESREKEEETEEDQDTSERITTTKTSILPQATPAAEPKPKSFSTLDATPSGFDFDQEKNQTLNLLASLFGSSAGNDEDEDDWIGKEFLDSDVNDAVFKQNLVQPRMDHSDIVDFEIVPRGGDRGKRHLQGDDHEAAVDMEMKDVSLEDKGTALENVPVKQHVPKAPEAPKKLKDLFGPVESEGVFSLLGHLNLDDDLELDEDIPFSIIQDLPQSPEQTISVLTTTPSATKTDSQRTRQNSQITLDPSLPLFFPLALLATHPLAGNSSFVHNPDAKNRPKDLFDTARAKGWDWPSSGFYKTQTEDEIRQRWEEQKGELTQGWKKRWREAGRTRRRRGKVGGGED